MPKHRLPRWDGEGMATHVEGALKTGLSHSTNRTIFRLSLVIIAIGAYGLFANKHSSLIFSIFAVGGLIIPALSLFIAFPIWPIAEESRPTSTGAPSADLGAPSRPATPTATRATTAKLPAAYGLAFSAAGFLSIIEGMINLSGGNYTSPETFTNAIVCGIIGSALLAFGFPGFHALQAARGGYSSLIGSVLGVTAALGSILDLWLREDAFADGISTSPASYHSVVLTTEAVGMFGSVLIAIAIANAGVYPRWTAAAQLINAFLALVFILLDGKYGAFMFSVFRLNELLQGAVVLVFAWRMLDLRVNRAS
jgi:hypothetical protein